MELRIEAAKHRSRESPQNRILRDFCRRLIFDFFNSIDPKRTWRFLL
jgi:hypothetical protein